MDLFGAAELGDRLVGFVGSAQFAPLAFGVAFAAGAAHAVGPGHGKSLAAAYLVGSDGTVRDAAWLGASVAVMHTVSVLVLAVAWTFFDLSGLIDLEHLTSGLQIVAGLMVILIGLWLLRRHFLVPAGEHGHGHGNGHGHGHGHEYGHRSRPGLVLLGMSGGLTPSPAAFLVLVAGLITHRSGFALLLVVVFGLGLATVLFAVGLLAIAGKSFAVRMSESRRVILLATRIAPVLGAASITAIGVVITAFGFSSLVAPA